MMPITIAGTQFRRSACDGCGEREQTTRRCLEAWLCLSCLRSTRWYAALSAPVKREIVTNFGQAFMELQDDMRADRLLLRSFSPARWAALEAAGV